MAGREPGGGWSQAGRMTLMGRGGRTVEGELVSSEGVSVVFCDGVVSRGQGAQHSGYEIPARLRTQKCYGFSIHTRT